MFAIRMEDHRPALISEGVPKHEQTMPRNRSFWAFFTANLILSNWVIGILGITLGLDVPSGIAAIVIGNLIGCALPGLLATMGPKTRLTQMESSRSAFGKTGTRLPSFINWLNCIGWDAVNNVPSAAALVGLCALLGGHIPFWAALLILSLIEMGIGFYGHHMVQFIQKTLGYALLLTFIGIGITTLTHTHGIVTAPHPVSLTAFVTFLGIIISNAAGYSPYASDYTRYLPATTPGRGIFGRVFVALFSSFIILELFGLLTAALVTDSTPQGVIAAIQANTGPFAPLALLVIIACCIPQNALNDNTGAYSLISAGIKIPRPLSAVLSGIVAFALAVYGAGRFTAFLESFLLLILYWVFPWAAIVLVDWFSNRKDSLTFRRGWGPGATIWLVTTILTIALFPATELYTGPIAKALGGLDIGYYVGFIVAGSWYWIALKRRAKTTISV